MLLLFNQLHLAMKIKLFCTVAFIAGFAANIPLANAQVKKPNVIIILVDDMGFGDVSVNNPQAKTKTPNIDQLAKNGINFTDAHSGGAVCTPSRYGLITGRYYFRLPQHREFLGYLPPLIEPGRQTIGSLMQQAGYTTACIGKWHLGVNWQVKDATKPQIPEQKDKTITNTDFEQAVSGGPSSLGFNYSYIIPASLDMPPYVFVKNNKVTDPNVMLTADAYPKKQPNTTEVWDRKYTNENDVYWERGVWWRNGEMSKSFKMEDCLDTIAQQGISFIKDQVSHNPQKPFMLYLALTGPHTPWLANRAYKGKTAMGTYGDFVAQIDNYIAEINGTLKKLNADKNTIIIFTSDNGAPWADDDIKTYNHQSNYSRRGQKGDIWDGGHHIPLIVKWPKQIKKPSVYKHTVSLVDMMATFAEMTGAKIGAKYAEDSFSFYKAMSGQTTGPVRQQIIYISSRNVLAIKKGDWKYIERLGSGGFTEPAVIKPEAGGPQGQLYNLAADPLETNNLYLQQPEKVKELSALLTKLKEQGYSK